MMCSKQKQHELIVSIGKAIDVQDWQRVAVLGAVLKKYEQPVFRTVKSIVDYEITYHDSKLSKLTTTVFRVKTVEDKEHYYYTTLNEVSKNLDIPFTKSLQVLKEINYKVEPIAEVFSECVNKIVYVYHNGKLVECGWYLDIAYSYNIHFEDLNDVIEERLGVYFEDKKYMFKYIESI